MGWGLSSGYGVDDFWHDNSELISLQIFSILGIEDGHRGCPVVTSNQFLSCFLSLEKVVVTEMSQLLMRESGDKILDESESVLRWRFALVEGSVRDDVKVLFNLGGQLSLPLRIWIG